MTTALLEREEAAAVPEPVSAGLSVTLARAELLPAVQAAARVIGRGKACPHVALTAAGASLSLAAANEETALTRRLAAGVTGEGQVGVSGKDLNTLIGGLPDGDILLREENTELVLTAGKSVFRLPTCRAESLPVVSTLPENAPRFSLPFPVLRELLAATGYAASEEDNRPTLTTICLTRDGKKLTAAATDANRLAVRSLPLVAATGETLLPRESARDLDAILKGFEGEIEIVTGEGEIGFDTGTTLFTSCVVSGGFPDWRRYVKREGEPAYRLTLPRAALLAALKRISLVRPEHELVTLEFVSGTFPVLVLTASGDGGQARDEVECSPSWDLTLHLSGPYLREALESLPGESVEFATDGALSPILLRPAGEGIDALAFIAASRGKGTEG